MTLASVTRALGHVAERWGARSFPPVTWSADTAQFAEAFMASGTTPEYAHQVSTTALAGVMDGVAALHVGPRLTGIATRLARAEPVDATDAALAVRTLSHELVHVATPVEHRTIANNGVLAEAVAEHAGTVPSRLRDVARALGLEPTARLIDDASMPLRDLHVKAGLIPPVEGATHRYDRLHDRLDALVSLAGHDPSLDGGTVESVRARLVDRLLDAHAIPATSASQRTVDHAVEQQFTQRDPKPLPDVLAALAATP